MAAQEETGPSMWTMDDAAAESDNGRGSPDKVASEESKVYSMLFRQCDEAGDGLVDIDVILDYIRKLQYHAPQQEGEEVFESLDSSSSMTYDLQTLKAMLECNCRDNKKIDEAAYSHIISCWVNHLRHSSSSASQNPDSPARNLLEVADLTDSPPSLEERNVSYGSYCHNDSRNSEEVGRRLSIRHETDEMISKLEFEIKCLGERNRALVQQYEGSEEALRDYQSKNKLLQAQLDETMVTLLKLRDLEVINAELNKTLSETNLVNQDLLWTKERLNRELEKVRAEYSMLEDEISNTRFERENVCVELKTTQTVLAKSKEQEKDVRNEMEIKMSESRVQLDNVINDLDETTSANRELKTIIFELEGQLLQARPEGVFTSTPFRVTSAVSLQEELEDHEERMTRGTPDISPLKMNGDVSPSPHREEERRSRHVETYPSPAMESLNKLIDETDPKIQRKHSLIMQELSDLILPVPSNSCLHGSSSIISFLGSSDLSSVETKLKSTIRTKNQFKKENMNLKKENSDLLARLNDLEGLLDDMQRATLNGRVEFDNSQWRTRSPGPDRAETSPRTDSSRHAHAETSPRMHSPGRSLAETSSRRHTHAGDLDQIRSPGQTHPEISSRSYSPAHTQDEMSLRNHSPGGTQTETSPYRRSRSPGGTQTETAPRRRSRSPGGTQTETAPHRHSRSPGGTQTETAPHRRSRSPGGAQTETAPHRHSRSPGGTQTETPPHRRSRSPGGAQTETPPHRRSRSPGGAQTETAPHRHSRSPGGTQTETAPHRRSRSPGGTQTETAPHRRSRSPGGTQTETPPHRRSRSPGGTQTETAPHRRSRSPGGTQTETSPYLHSHSPRRTQTETSPPRHSPRRARADTFPRSHSPGRTQVETSPPSHSRHTQARSSSLSVSPGHTQPETLTRGLGDNQAQTSTHRSPAPDVNKNAPVGPHLFDALPPHSPIVIDPLSGGSYERHHYTSTPVADANLSKEVVDGAQLSRIDEQASGHVSPGEENLVPVNEHVLAHVDTSGDHSRVEEGYHFPSESEQSFMAYRVDERILPVARVRGEDVDRREVGEYSGGFGDELATRHESGMDESPRVEFAGSDSGTDGLPRSSGTKSGPVRPAHYGSRDGESRVGRSPPRHGGKSVVSMKTDSTTVEETGSDLLAMTPLPKTRRRILQEPEQDLLDEAIGGVVDIRPTFSPSTYSSLPRTPLSTSDMWITDSNVPCTDEKMLGSSPVPRVRHLLHEDPEMKMHGPALARSGGAVATTSRSRATSQSVLDNNCLTIFGVLKNAVMLLLLIVLIMAFLVLIILSQDAMERCGSYCPHSPVHFLYSTFEPYLQYSKERTQI